MFRSFASFVERQTNLFGHSTVQDHFYLLLEVFTWLLRHIPYNSSHEVDAKSRPKEKAVKSMWLAIVSSQDHLVDMGLSPSALPLDIGSKK